MYKIQTNISGTRNIELTDNHLETIDKYSLLNGLIPSSGIVNETTLEQLKHNAKSFILANDDCKDLIALCHDVLYHDNMKVFGLKELIMLYVNWKDAKETENELATND